MKSVDDYVAAAEPWVDEITRLRELLLASGLTETVKWGSPCYTLHGKNVVGLAAFKAYFGLWFFQGALLEDAAGVLINAQEGKTRAMRQWRMSSSRDIKPVVIRRYVREAAQLVRDGKQIKPQRKAALELPPALDQALRGDRAAADGFAELRQGQQREYVEFVASAKRADTVARRIDKILPLLASGAGLNDRYRK